MSRTYLDVTCAESYPRAKCSQTGDVPVVRVMYPGTVLPELECSMRKPGILVTVLRNMSFQFSQIEKYTNSRRNCTKIKQNCYMSYVTHILFYFMIFS